MTTEINRTTFVKKDLFGGAIIAALPESFTDVSKFRDVPDHQEVFNDDNTDTSLIVELFDYDTELSDDKAIRHYFDDLAKFNESTNYSVASDNIIENASFIPAIAPEHCRIALIGQQSVTKFRDRPDAPVDEVYIVLVLLRLKSVKTDLLVSLNIPVKSERVLEKEPDFDHSLLHVNMLLPEQDLTTDEELYRDVCRVLPGIEVLKGFLQQLDIKDWTLFVNK